MTKNTKRYVAAVMVRQDREREARTAMAMERIAWCALSAEEELEADAILHAPDDSEDITVVVQAVP